MDDNDSGTHPVVDYKAQLLQTALSLAIHHPRASADWYASLSESDLQTLSAGIGEMLTNINKLISTLRGHVKDDDPKLREALSKLQPLIEIKNNLGKAKR